VPGEKGDVRIFAAMRDRNSRVGRTCDRRSHPWNYHEGQPCRSEGLRLFRSATKDKWIAAFEPDDLFSLARFFHQQRVDFILRERVRAGFFPGENQFRAFRSPAQHLRIAQVIVNNDLSLLDALFGPQGHESQIARTRADQETDSLRFLIPH